MNLQQLLIQLRGEETPNQAALRMGLSPNYYRDLERGYYLQSRNPVNPSKETLQKIATAFKVDYTVIANAAGISEERQDNTIPFANHPHLHQWYNSLPSENIEDIDKLYNVWQLLKGGNKNVL